MNPTSGLPLSRARVRVQFVRLLLRRLLGRHRAGPYRFAYPEVEVHAAKNPWLLYREIFLRECYRPAIPLGPKPRILDLGANIGLASLYFLTRWPEARLVAHEPNPRAHSLLALNLRARNFPSAEIRVEPTAVSTSDGQTSFSIPAGNPTAVFAGLTGRATTGIALEQVTVPTVDAAPLFSEPADLVKLDIEGHEYDVLEHALPRAGAVRSLIVEFHELRQNADRCRILLERLLGEAGYVGTDESGQPLDPTAFTRRTGAGVAHLHDRSRAPTRSHR